MIDPITVEVTENNILCGDRFSKKTCAIALALRYGHGATHIHVSEDRIGFKLKNGGTRVYKTPPVAVRFIERYDRREKVEPFSFTLE